MNIKRINSIYFSPNGSTKKIVNSLVKGIGVDKEEEFDLSLPGERDKKKVFGKDDLLVIGFPVYSDRLPTIADKIIGNLSGKNTLAVILVSYGNRDYGDALRELKDKLEKRGFKIIAGAAIVGEHCLNTNIARNRPDKKDNIKILDFGRKIKKKIKNINKLEDIESVEVKGEYPYKTLKKSRTPIGDYQCIQCGICQENCPVDAIDKEDYRNTDSHICIFCGKCIQVCPTHARDIKDQSFIESMEKLETITEKRREIEEFL